MVLIHEFGHFWVAKKTGMIVEEFGLGLPPRVWGIKWRGTLYSLNALPFGGFVKIFGENPNEVPGSKDPAHKAFYRKSWYQRAAVIVAGPIMNFILAVVVISYLFTTGVHVPSGIVKVVGVQKNSPAANAGLKKDDVLVSITAKNIPIKSNQQFITEVQKNLDKKVVVVYERKGVAYKTLLTPRKNPPKGQGAVGVTITDAKLKRYSWLEAPFVGLRESLRMSWDFYRELGKIFITLLHFQNPHVQVAGPVGIAQLTGQAVKSGFESVIQLLGLLSLNLALINLLPFPALDGGQLTFVLYEAVTRRQIKDDIKARINAVGFAFLLLLIIVITVSDVVKLFAK